MTGLAVVIDSVVAKMSSHTVAEGHYMMMMSRALTPQEELAEEVSNTAELSSRKKSIVVELMEE